MSFSRIFSILASLGIFLIISTPSIKIFFYSNFINALGIITFIVFSLFNIRTYYSLTDLLLIICWSAFSILLIVGFVNGGYFDFFVLVKYVYLILIVFTLLFTYTSRYTSFLIKILVSWSLVLSLYEIFIGFNLDREYGQHYLTVATPIGAGVSLLLCMQLSKGLTLNERISLALISMVLILGVLNTHSRSALIFPALTFLLVGAFYIVFSKSLGFKSRLLGVGGMAALFSIIAFAIYYFDIEITQYDRIQRLLTGFNDEPRIATYYLTAMTNISESPIFGYGTNSSVALYGNYPHNIFFEILTFGGVILLFPFLIILFIFTLKFRCLINRVDRSPTSFALFGLSFYFFLLWNVSWGVDTSYMFLIPMLMSIALIQDPSKQRGSN